MATERDKIGVIVDKFNTSPPAIEARIKENLLIDGSYDKTLYGNIRKLLKRIASKPK